jgi:hypothetical protein
MCGVHRRLDVWRSNYREQEPLRNMCAWYVPRTPRNWRYLFMTRTCHCSFIFHPYNRKYPGITKGKTFRFPNMNILICLFFLVIQIVNVVECSEVGKTLLLFCMKNQNNKRIKHNMQGKIYKWKSKNKS